MRFLVFSGREIRILSLGSKLVGPGADEYAMHCMTGCVVIVLVASSVQILLEARREFRRVKEKYLRERSFFGLFLLDFSRYSDQYSNQKFHSFEDHEQSDRHLNNKIRIYTKQRTVRSKAYHQTNASHFISITGCCIYTAQHHFPCHINTHALLRCKLSSLHVLRNDL